MNDRGNAWLRASGSRITRRSKNVLAIPCFNFMVSPHPPAHIIDAPEAFVVEQSLPIAKPLTINIVLTKLPRTRRREKDKVGVPAKGADQRFRRLLTQMLGDLETDHRVEVAVQIQRG